MIEIGSFEAKNKFSELINRAKNGEEIIVTLRGVPTARITSVNTPKGFDRAAAIQAAKEIGEISKVCILGDDLTVMDLIREGRKWV